MRPLPTFLFAIVLALPACGLIAPEADRVAENFWKALADGEVEDAKALSTEVDVRRLARLTKRHEIEDVEVGAVLTRDEVAEVETTLVRESGAKVIFSTHLRRYDGGWRVDAASTSRSLREAIVEDSLADLRDAFNDSAGAIGEAVEQGLEEAAAAIREALGESEGAARPSTP
ncbi:MAG: hypothetical protein JRH01_05780 [Deltaproteobacteria bacterium]|nr:hypothetical protein [Deltaproteobacteria bacterium]MBW2394692.1 hypothetical protein [Deltaproteobacteria bacterium]